MIYDNAQFDQSWQSSVGTLGLLKARRFEGGVL